MDSSQSNQFNSCDGSRKNPLSVEYSLDMASTYASLPSMAPLDEAPFDEATIDETPLDETIEASKVGLMLRGTGFNNNTSIYLASGKIYKAEKTMTPLLEMFPLLQTKEMLASAEELAPFKNYSSRMAAIDYSVCLHSEVFVTTQGGNFPHFLVGHRRYLYGGHSKTIKPDKRKLALLFDNPNIGWKSLKRQLLNM